MTVPPSPHDSTEHHANRGRTRRAALSAAAATGLAGLAGCLGPLGGDDGEFRTGEPPDVPQVEDPPDAVYVPSHREGMRMLDPVDVGEYRLAPMLTYAHPFWIVSGDDVEPSGVGEADDVHLMAALWDADTGTVLPTDEGLSMTVSRDGDLVDSRSPWPMLSQTMGFHFGDNVALDGDGTYEVEFRIPPVGARTTGAFEGRFDDPETVTVEFEYDDAFRDAAVDGIEYFDEDVAGDPGAIEPGHGMGGDMGDGEDGTSDDGMDGMDDRHDVPVSELPEASALPGTHQGTEITDDADLVLSVADGFLGDDPYLLVSPRTPYNRIPLPGMTLSVDLVRDGEVIEERDLVPTLDDRAGFHYGVEAPALQSGDDLTIAVEAPPQVARHQGYETAFVDMAPVEFAIEGW